MKETIKEHEERLTIFLKTLEKRDQELAIKKQELARQIQELGIQWSHYRFYLDQILEAKRQGKDCFDADRFMRSNKNG